MKQTKMEIIKRIQNSGASENIKQCLLIVASEFETFLELKRKHSEGGLMKACYKVLGVKFIGMYSIEKLEDLVKKAELKNLLA